MRPSLLLPLQSMDSGATFFLNAQVDKEHAMSWNKLTLVSRVFKFQFYMDEFMKFDTSFSVAPNQLWREISCVSIEPTDNHHASLPFPYWHCEHIKMGAMEGNAILMSQKSLRIQQWLNYPVKRCRRHQWSWGIRMAGIPFLPSSIKCTIIAEFISNCK